MNEDRVERDLEMELEMTRKEADAYVNAAVQKDTEIARLRDGIMRAIDSARADQKHIRSSLNLEVVLRNLETVLDPNDKDDFTQSYT